MIDDVGDAGQQPVQLEVGGRAVDRVLRGDDQGVDLAGGDLLDQPAQRLDPAAGVGRPRPPSTTTVVADVAEGRR